jgi:serine-type D-Ala-D-Ala carboxypeptidase (penicillin-binding protein 5/6)
VSRCTAKRQHIDTTARKRATLGGAARLLVSGALALALMAGAPASALAARSDSDRVGGVALSVGKVPRSAAPDINAAAGALVTEDGRVIWGRKADKRRAMASTTKMMTALLVLENIDDLNKTVTVSSAASKVAYGLGLKPGERVSVRRLLELTLVASSNDGAHALGEAVSGDMGSFVKLMNRRAAELGMEDTSFANPHGLDAKNHYSTPIDLARLSQQAMGHKEYRRIVAKPNVTMPNGGRTIKSTSSLLLGQYRGLAGGKTGFTRGAMYSYVSTAERDGVKLTAVVLGASSHADRFAQTRRLFDWGFKNISENKTIAKQGEELTELPIAANPEHTVPVLLGEGAKARVYKFDGPVKQETDLPEELTLPVFKGQPLGEVKLKQGKHVLATLPAVAATSSVSVEETVGVVPVSDYLNRTVTARAAKVDPDLAPEFDADKPVEQRVELKEHVSAPVAKGDKLGEIVYSQDGEVLVTVPVVAVDAVAVPTFAQSLQTAFARGWRGLIGGQTMATLEVVVP